jgi:glutamine synthetase
VIAAGLDGIDRRLPLAEPVIVDPHTLSETDRRLRHADRLPQSLKEAVDNLKQDSVLSEALGAKLLTSYTAVKEMDIDAFANADEAFEFKQHLYKY